MITLLSVASLAAIAAASPVERRAETTSIFNLFAPCKECLRSSWTRGPECTSDKTISSVLSRITNPPASATPTFAPAEWCSQFLRQTDLSIVYEASTGIRTETEHTLDQQFATVTDYDHPTSTMYCPSPSPGMECGWSNPGIIYPIEQGLDWTTEHYYNPEECHQICLEREACRAFWIPSADATAGCTIYNVGLGPGATNVASAYPGDQWYDRNCQQFLPAGCKGQNVARGPEPTPPPLAPRKVSPRDPLITPAAQLKPRVVEKSFEKPVENELAKRDAPVPDFLPEFQNFWSYLWLTPACSCFITSAYPPVGSTSTSTYPVYTDTTTITETFHDTFTVTVTPRSTTIYTSIW